MHIGTTACHNSEACFGTIHSTIEYNTCHGNGNLGASYRADKSMIKKGKYVGKEVCVGVKLSSIGNNLCRGNTACADLIDTQSAMICVNKLDTGGC